MKTVAAFLLALTFAFTLHAQTTDDVARQLVARELASSQAYETLSYLTDEIGPRLSGSPNAAYAVKWTTERLRSWGVDVHTEKVMVPHWVRGIETGSLVSHRNQKLALTALGGSVATPATGITADVIEAKSFDDLKLLGDKIKGKIVYFHNPMRMDLVTSGRAFEAYGEAVAYRGTGASRAAAYGAKAVVIMSVASASLRTPHTGSMRYDAAQPKIPAAALSVEDAQLVHRLLAKGQRVRMHLTLTPKTLPDVESANVIAEIRGSEHPEEIVVLGGHLDSWDLGTGAIDDGAGVAMSMEVMRLIKQMNLRPKRTIRCVLFMNEENGLKGGKQYFANHKNDKHVAAIETDAGGAAPTGFTTTLHGDPLADLERRTGVLDVVGAHKFETSEETGADTSPLTEAGVTGFGLVPDPRHYFDLHHSAADTLDKVDPTDLAKDSAAMAALTWVLAN